MDEYIYDAFISYSHRDLSWARWLQRRLESYRIPRDLCGERARRHLRVFRDQTDLAGVELQEALQRELRVSRNLIVICSPSSAASPWVNDEIRYFRSLGGPRQIIPFIVDGEPESDRPELECYPPALRQSADEHPLGANAPEIGRAKAFLKLMAILLDVRFNRLVDRDKQRRRRTGLIGGSAAAVILTAGSLLLWHNAVISRQNQALSYDIYGAALVSIAQKDVIEAADVAFLQTSAEAGNSAAMLLLADCYRNGWGTEADPDQAFRWFRAAAEAGDPAGMVGTANCYSNGWGTETDPAQAFYWDRQAAEAGEPSAMVNLGICYEEGLGTEADVAEAFAWYRRAAEQGNDLGVYHLARCYSSGLGTEQDAAEAFRWMTKLAGMGNPWGMYNLGLMYQYGYGTEENAEAAYQWYLASARAGDADGMYKTGWCIENGYGTEDQALEWYRQARDLGNADAAEAAARLENAG